MGYTNSKKYDGVQLYQKMNKDISYYIRYKDENEKLVRIKIGDKSKGITEPYCKQKRDEILNKIRLGEDIKIKHKKQKVVTLDELAKVYFDDKDLENKTNKKLEGKYNLHLKGIFGDRNINSLNKDDILELRKKLMMDNKSNETINGIMALLNAIINYSIKEKGLILRYCKNRVVIHTLRHTFASQLAINGTPIFTIQKLMNHSNINMTLRYAKLSPDSGRDFVNDLYK